MSVLTPRAGRLHLARAAALAAALAALAPGGCASSDTQAAPPAASAPATASAAPATPASDPTPAPTPAPPRTVADFVWPDPLPACAADVPWLFKGLVIGTWVPEGDAGFDQSWIDEAELREAWTKAGASRRTWKGFSVADPTVKLDSLLSDRPGPAVGYLFSLVARTGGGPEIGDAPAVVHLRHRGRLRAYFDGMLLLDLPAPAAGEWGEARAPVVLSGLYSVLLLKLGRGDTALGPSMDVEVRVSAPDGSALPGQTWNTMRPGVLPSDG
jgi:hypothetical protein